MPRIVWIFIWITVGAYLLQNVFQVGWTGEGDGRVRQGGLTFGALADGQVYVLLTSILVDSPLGLIVNLLALYFLGKEIARMTGPAQFTLLYLVGAIVGNLLELAAKKAVGSDIPIAGASGGISALLGALAIMQPNSLAGLPPLLTFRLINLAWTWVILNAVIGLVSLNVPELSQSGWACAAGTLYGFLHGRSFLMAGNQPRKAAAAPRAKTPAYSKRKDTPNVIDAEFTDKKPDYNAVLDKINKEGMGSLTPQERKILEQASEALNKGKRQ